MSKTMPTSNGTVKLVKRQRIAKRAAEELTDGIYCNLGIGMPEMIADLIQENINAKLHGENGIIGLGPHAYNKEIDPDLTNASKEPVTAFKGHCFTRSSDSFGIIRGNHLHMTILGGMQVSEKGDLANWLIPGEKIIGMGGAMDLVNSGSRVVVTMEHCNSKGNTKVVKACTLPLTGRKCVSMVITDMGVFEFKNEQMYLTEIFSDPTLEEIKMNTTASFEVASNLKIRAV